MESLETEQIQHKIIKISELHANSSIVREKVIRKNKSKRSVLITASTRIRSCIKYLRQEGGSTRQVWRPLFRTPPCTS